MAEKIAILGGNRIPFARSNGPYARASNQDMLTATLDGLVARFGLQGERAGEVVAGAVLKHPKDFNLTRECVLGSALDHSTPAYDLQQACDTGLQAALAVAGKIALGQIEWGIAGGVDTTSDAPIGVNEDLRQVLLEANRTKSVGGRVKLLGHLRPHHVVPQIPRNAEPRTGMSMGEHQAITSERMGITREDQDKLTVASHQGLAAAYERGFFDDLVTPYLGLTRDQNLRPDSSTDKLAKLKPVFGDTMTAGNSTPLSDGAAALILASAARADDLGVIPLARVVSSAVYGNDPLLMGIAPAWALPLALRRAGLTPEQIDVWEIHEAFSAQALGVLRELPNQLDGFQVPDDKLTPNGGAVAIGHPFGATGVRYALTLATELRERHLRYGAIGVCIGSGQGVAMILENPHAA